MTDKYFNTEKILALVLAGGKGSRMGILADHRAKPSLPFAGSFRLIDIPLSNLVHSALSDVWIIEQYRPHGLNEHLANGRPWNLDRTQGGLRVMPPYEGNPSENDGMAKGNADAIHRHIHLIKDFDPDIIIVLSADHVYKMDLRPVVGHLLETGADAVFVTNQSTREHATRFGVVESDDSGWVKRFEYKPDNPAANIVTTEIFLFNAGLFFDTMDVISRRGEIEDYGDEMIPHMVENYRIQEYRFTGYWRDVGTIEGYWKVHLDLLQDPPEFPIDDLSWPILTRDPQRPPAMIFGSARVDNGRISPGCQIRGNVFHSVLSPGVVVEAGAEVHNSILLEDVQVGKGARIINTIIDQNARIGENATVGLERLEHPDEDITLIEAHARIPAGSHAQKIVRADSAQSGKK